MSEAKINCLHLRCLSTKPDQSSQCPETDFRLLSYIAKQRLPTSDTQLKTCVEHGSEEWGSTDGRLHALTRSWAILGDFGSMDAVNRLLDERHDV